MICSLMLEGPFQNMRPALFQMISICICIFICICFVFVFANDLQSERPFQNMCPALFQMSLWVACLLSTPPRKMALTLCSFLGQIDKRSFQFNFLDVVKIKSICFLRLIQSKDWFRVIQKRCLMTIEDSVQFFSIICFLAVHNNPIGDLCSTLVWKVSFLLVLIHE